MVDELVASEKRAESVFNALYIAGLPVEKNVGFDEALKIVLDMFICMSYRSPKLML